MGLTLESALAGIVVGRAREALTLDWCLVVFNRKITFSCLFFAYFAFQVPFQWMDSLSFLVPSSTLHYFSLLAKHGCSIFEVFATSFS